METRARRSAFRAARARGSRLSIALTDDVAFVAPYARSSSAMRRRESSADGADKHHTGRGGGTAGLGASGAALPDAASEASGPSGLGPGIQLAMEAAGLGDLGEWVMDLLRKGRLEV